MNHPTALSSNPVQDQEIGNKVSSSLVATGQTNHFKPGVKIEDLYHSYKHTPHSPNSLLLKFAVHRAENHQAYQAANPKQRKAMDSVFLAHHTYNVKPGKLDHITTDSLNQGLSQNPHLIPNLLSHQRSLHDTLLQHAPQSLDQINNTHHLRLVRNMSVHPDKKGDDHALYSMADKEQPQFGEHEYHQHVPLKNVWFSYELGPKSTMAAGHPHEDEFVVSAHKSVKRDKENFFLKDVVNSTFGAPHAHGSAAAPHLARHKQLTSQEIISMMSHPSWGVRKTLLSHPNADESVIQHGSKDPDRNVSKWAGEMAKRKGIILKTEHAIEAMYILGWPKPDEDILQKASKESDKRSGYKPLFVCMSIGDIYGYVENCISSKNSSELMDKFRKLQHVKIDIESFIEMSSGKMLSCAGADFVFTIPPSEKSDLIELIKKIKNKVDLFCVAGIGSDLEEAATAGIQAKMKGKQILEWSGDLDSDLKKSESRHIDLIHFSQHPDINVLDPAYQFKGQAGKEKGTIKLSREHLAMKAPHVKPVPYLHTYPAGDLQAEGIFNGNMRYHIKVPKNKIYDLSLDKDRVFDKIKSENSDLYYPGEHALAHPDLVHGELKRRGYLGWMASGHSDPRFAGSVMLYDQIPVTHEHHGEMSAVKIKPDGTSLQIKGS